jgi:hypothetical protein
MNLENEIIYVKNKKYIYVLTNNDDNNNELDLSIFEIEEWTHLTKISKVFEDCVVYLDNVDKPFSPYININLNLKRGVYYLYFSPFCCCKGFNDLEFEILHINNIYEVVFNLAREDKKITINKFRRWIIDNYKKIQIHYDNLLDNIYLFTSVS